MIIGLMASDWAQDLELAKYRDKDAGILKNADGWDIDGHHGWVKSFVRSPGPDGLILWYDGYRGSAEGRGKLANWMIDLR